MPDQEVEEQPGSQTAEAAQGCPVEMYTGRCGRRIHAAPAGVDQKPVCLMHSRDPNKDDAAFQAEFERILCEAADALADFSGFVFPAARYERRTFRAECVFLGATFAGLANFFGATFLRDASFASAKFLGVAVFGMAKFEGHAHFSHATFSDVADLRYGAFEKDVDFVGTEFKDTADFNERTFRTAVSFEGAWFGGAVNFLKTVFRKDEVLHAGPIFMNARFDEPDWVLFYETYLGQALFHNCDVSRFVFRDVDWRVRKNRKSKVFEEDVAFYSRVTKPLQPKKDIADERNYRLIAELYQQLKKNFDDRRDYWTAGDFHYGEMEMKRLHSSRRNRALRWLHQNLGLVAWYKYASEYGESYGRPLLWLVGILVLFMLLFPIWGLRPTDKSSTRESTSRKSRPLAEGNMSELSYTNFIRYGSAEAGAARVSFWSLLGHSLMTTIGVASFQRDLAYEPAYPWGKLLAILETLFTSMVLALFLLAVRRQFRR